MKVWKSLHFLNLNKKKLEIDVFVPVLLNLINKNKMSCQIQLLSAEFDWLLQMSYPCLYFNQLETERIVFHMKELHWLSEQCPCKKWKTLSQMTHGIWCQLASESNTAL